jgi:hypothetical protein
VQEAWQFRRLGQATSRLFEQANPHHAAVQIHQDLS